MEALTACLICYVCSGLIPMVGWLHVTASAKPCSHFVKRPSEEDKATICQYPIFVSLFLYFLPWIFFQRWHSSVWKLWQRNTLQSAAKSLPCSLHNQMTIISQESSINYVMYQNAMFIDSYRNHMLVWLGNDLARGLRPSWNLNFFKLFSGFLFHCSHIALGEQSVAVTSVAPAEDPWA